MYIGTYSPRGNNYYYYYRFTLTEVTTPRGSRRRRRRRCIRRSDARVYNIILYIPHIIVHDKRQVSPTLSLFLSRTISAQHSSNRHSLGGGFGTFRLAKNNGEPIVRDYTLL